MNPLLFLLARIMIPLSCICMYVFLGISASIIWLFQFLKRDVLPEPAKMILKIFFWGMLITLPVLLVELGASKIIVGLNLPRLFTLVLYWFLAIALVEETFKYLVVRIKILKSYEFDEPVDTMIYMAVVALGFAALENIFYLVPSAEKMFSLGELIMTTAAVSFFRFVGATFLHALCSAMVGYFLALSLCKRKNMWLTAFGLFFAVLLHGLYNFSIMEIETPLNIIIPIIILLWLAIFVSFAFNNLKKLKSICKV